MTKKNLKSWNKTFLKVYEDPTIIAGYCSKYKEELFNKTKNNESLCKQKKKCVGVYRLLDPSQRKRNFSTNLPQHLCLFQHLDVAFGKFEPTLTTLVRIVTRKKLKQETTSLWLEGLLRNVESIRRRFHQSNPKTFTRSVSGVIKFSHLCNYKR